MKVEFVNPFIQAASEVLDSELGTESQRGNLRLHKSAFTTDEVTALVGVTGTLSGLVLYSMSQTTALGIVSKMIGQDFDEFDALAQSGIGELGNVITTLDLHRLVFPLQTEVGSLEIQVVLKAAA